MYRKSIYTKERVVVLDRILLCGNRMLRREHKECMDLQGNTGEN